MAFIYTGEVAERGREEMAALANHLQLKIDLARGVPKGPVSTKLDKEVSLESDLDALPSLKKKRMNKSPLDTKYWAFYETKIGHLSVSS